MQTSIYHEVISSAPELLGAIQQNPDGATILIAFLAFLAWMKHRQK